MTNSDITFRDDMTVSLVKASASDSDVVWSARVSTEGNRSLEALEADPEASAGLIRYLIKNRHSSPLEHSVFTFYIETPIFVVRELERHRIASYNEECLSGKTIITRLGPNNDTMHKKNSSIEVLYRNWHEGVPDTKGRVRKLASCRNIYVRSYDEETLKPVKSKVKNVLKKGVQTTYKVITDSEYEVRATMSHEFFTPEGWKTLRELNPGDYVYRAGLVNENEEERMPPRLREGIQNWTTQKKPYVIGLDGGICYLCGAVLTYSEAEIDHMVPVVKDITKALDIKNLAPACKECHRRKTNTEQIYASRSLTGSLRPTRIISIGEPEDEETYDLVLESPHHNYLANRLMVHNSGRYKELRPVFYVPGPDRKLVQVGKTGHYQFEDGTYMHKKVVSADIKRIATESFNAYRHLLDLGIAKEVSRMVLPVNIYTSLYMTVNARSLMNILSLRTNHPEAAYPSKPMREIEMVAEQMEAIFAEKMPITYQAFVDNGRVSP